jgi:hypothetical protein
MHLEPGQDFEVFIDDQDTITLRRINLDSAVQTKIFTAKAQRSRRSAKKN